MSINNNYINTQQHAIDTLVKATEFVDKNIQSLSINQSNLLLDTSHTFIIKIKGVHLEKVINIYKLFNNNLKQEFINLISISDITKDITPIKNSTRTFKDYILQYEKIRITGKDQHRLFLTKKGLEKFIKYVDSKKDKKVNIFCNNKIDNNEFVNSLLFIKNQMI